jgi:hypothetical protein
MTIRRPMQMNLHGLPRLTAQRARFARSRCDSHILEPGRYSEATTRRHSTSIIPDFQCVAAITHTAPSSIRCPRLPPPDVPELRHFLFFFPPFLWAHRSGYFDPSCRRIGFTRRRNIRTPSLRRGLQNEHDSSGTILRSTEWREDRAVQERDGLSGCPSR